MNGSEPWASRGADPPSAAPPGWPELESSAGRLHNDGLRFAPTSYLSAPPGALQHQQPPPPPFPHHHQQLRRELSFEPPGSGFGAFQQQQQQPTHLQHHNHHPHHQQQQQAYPPHLQPRASSSESVFGGPSSGAFPLGPPLPGASGGMLSSSPLESGTPLHGHFGMTGPPPLPPPPPPPLGMGGMSMGPMDLGLGGPSALSGGNRSSSSQQHLGASASGFPSLLPPPGSADHHLGNAQVFYHLQFQQQRHLQQQQQQHDANGFSGLQQSGLASSRFARPQQQQQAPPLPQFDLSQSMLQMSLSSNSSPDAPTSSLSEPSPLASLAASASLSSSSSSSSDPFAAWASPAPSSSAVASSSSVASAASLRDQMNQQMAALYQHEPSSSTLSQQHEPLAPSGSALLGLLNSSSSSSSTVPSGRDFGDAHAFPDLPDLSSIDLLGATPSPPMMLRIPPPPQQQAPPPHLVANGGYPNNQPHHRLMRRSPPPLPQQNSHMNYSARSGDSAFGSKSRSDKDAIGTSSSSSDIVSSIDVSPDVTKPNGNIKVQVSLLADECAPGRVLMVGLFRNGQLTNERPIFVKQVLFENKLNRNYRFLNTRITFRAPRSPGEFAFRVFESRRPAGAASSSSSAHHQHSPEDRDAPAAVYSNVTIARSNTLKVTMEYAHFIETLRTTHDRFRSGVASGDPSVVLSSLLSLLRLIDLVETVFLHGNVLFTEFVDACLQLVSLRAARVAALFTATDACPNPMESFHGTMRNVFNSIQTNPFVKELIADDVLRTVDRFQRALYCQASGYFFQTPADRRAYWETHFGFTPVAFGSDANDTSDSTDADEQQQRKALLASPFVRASVSDWVTREAQRLIPDRDAFRRARQAIYNTVHANVVARLPIHADLDVFGSSANDFGTHASDMDMCLVLETPATTADEKQQVLKLVVALLERQPHLFRDIDASRLTARIPIVMFTMADSGVECDLSVENVLAQRNTAILRAYANADSRVRVLAYVLKRFVKRRRMNSPFEGTLSSYGYLLMLIHYLQRQDPPVLPVLQSLPPTWDGTQSCDCSPTRVWCSLQSPQCALSERHVDMGLPSVQCRGPADDSDVPQASSRSATVETYFYDPFAFPDPAPKLALLAAFGARNTASVGELLVGFFEYFGVRFDASREVVSVRMARTLSKDEKKRAHQWRMHTRVSIEDPFEVAYDVAHVLKGSRDKYIRQQFARAYSLLAHGALQANEGDSSSSGSRDAAQVDAIMSALMDEVHDPPFLQSSSSSGGASAGALTAAGDDDSSGAGNSDVDASGGAA